MAAVKNRHKVGTSATLGIVAASALISVLVVGSFAAFTSSDSAAQQISTAASGNIEFDASGRASIETNIPNLIPGDEIEKIYTIENDAGFVWGSASLNVEPGGGSLLTTSNNDDGVTVQVDECSVPYTLGPGPTVTTPEVDGNPVFNYEAENFYVVAGQGQAVLHWDVPVGYPSWTWIIREYVNGGPAFTVIGQIFTYSDVGGEHKTYTVTGVPDGHVTQYAVVGVSGDFVRSTLFTQPNALGSTHVCSGAEFALLPPTVSAAMAATTTDGGTPAGITSATPGTDSYFRVRFVLPLTASNAAQSLSDFITITYTAEQ